MATPNPYPLLVEVDQYIERLFVPRDAVLEESLKAAIVAGLPEIHVSPNEGKLLYLLAKLSGAKRVLEIGLLGGYSTIWLARAIAPKGHLVSLELDENYVRVAGKNLELAGLRSMVDIRQGAASATLEKMVITGEAPFDLVFIDADKDGYPVYLDYALKLTKPGSLILADNVIRRIADTMVNHEKPKPGAPDPLLGGIEEFNRKLAGNPKLESIVVTVTREFVDGLAIARVKD
jgi:predicted O-methyltransferase YrrM